MAPLHALSVNVGTAIHLEFHPGGRYLLVRAITKSEQQDGHPEIWDLDRERRLPRLGGRGSAPAAAWSADGRWLASADSQGRVTVARFPEDRERRQIAWPGRARLLAFSRNWGQ